ncbi:hypothetical protein H6P81_015580 [Aristolochia fimbriata]|uniref:Uncharacterized protein n=1 Tax=Aristolochia fimbriata TaxID=158543 RepID=A0AAV7E5Y8_ARIFI|nr:hypothetical protein H6P81_015580 [Aristolochia fimbriata]
MATDEAHDTDDVILDMGKYNTFLTDEELNNAQPMIHTIFPVPRRLKNRNPEAYSPQMVSVGPYHYGEPHLKPMDEQKRTALRDLLRSSGRQTSDFIGPLKRAATALMRSYERLDEKWIKNEDGFLRLMLLDGSFLWAQQRKKDPPAVSHFFQRSPSDVELEEDLHMVENQLPLLVLNIIEAVAAWNFTSLRNLLESKGDARGREAALLGARIRYHIGNADSFWEPRDTLSLPNVKSLSHYKRAGGVVLSCSNSVYISTLSFDLETGKLSLPFLYMVPGNERTLYLNAVAYERLHPQVLRPVVTSFLWILLQLIRSADDVAMLDEDGILNADSREAFLDALIRLGEDMGFVPYTVYEPPGLLENLELFCLKKTPH